MAIEGISSAVNMNSTPVKQEMKREDAATSAVSVTSQLKVDTVKPVVAKENAGSSKSWDEKKDDDKGLVKSESEKEVSPEKVKSAVEDINKQIKSQMRHTNLSFKYHEKTNRISVTVKDSDTDEVIKEIPAEKALDMLAKAWEIAGLLVDEKR